MPLTCFCTSPCNGSTLGIQTCRGSRGSVCFSAVHIVPGEVEGTSKALRSFGCIDPNDKRFQLCKKPGFGLQTSTHFTCCRDFDLCNAQHLSQVQLEPLVSGRDILIPVVIGATATTLTVFLFGMLVWTRKRLIHPYGIFRDSPTAPIENLPASAPKEAPGKQRHFSTYSSPLGGSTLELEIKMVRSIGRGRYGEVFLGDRNGRPVAVKAFWGSDEASWENEKDVLHQMLLCPNPNILEFVAADIVLSELTSQMLLVTEYHELGSLYDFLGRNCTDASSTFRMAFSLASGLAYLHDDTGKDFKKPAIAHRDIKSKNILVKNKHGHLCIADFGMAIMCHSGCELSPETPSQVGTWRYMAPEILNNSIDVRQIQSFKSADVYALSLVFWEICRRCTIGVGSCAVMSRQLPYFSSVSQDPTKEEMTVVACKLGLRPSIPGAWRNLPILKELSTIMGESWQSDPEARLLAIRIKNKLFNINFNRKETNFKYFI